MTECIAMCVLYLLALKFVEYPIRKKLEQEQNPDAFNQWRRHLTLIRWGAFALIYGLMLAYYLSLSYYAPRVNFLITIIATIGFPHVVQYYSERNVLERYGLLNPSIDLCKKVKKGILFLRPFRLDDYTPRQESQNENKFSEQRLLAGLELYMPIYAIGKPQEMNVPSGAKRLYVDKGNWHELVVSMMLHNHILILVPDNSESCLWEFEQAQSFRHKLIIIVDDDKVYSCLRERFRDKILLPELISEGCTPFLLLHDGKEYRILPFSYTGKSCQLFATAILQALTMGNVKRPFLLTQWIMRHVLPMSISGCCMLVVALISWHSSDNEVCYAACCWFALSCIISLWCLSWRYYKKRRFNRLARPMCDCGRFRIYDALRACVFPVPHDKNKLLKRIREIFNTVWSKFWRCAVTLILLAVCIMQAKDSYDRHEHIDRAKEWPQVPALVTITKVAGSYHSDSSISYSYVYEGNTYTDDELYYDAFNFIECHNISDCKLPVSIVDVCYVNPDNPAENLLKSECEDSLIVCLLSWSPYLLTLLIVPWCIVTIIKPRKHFV